jgi:AcrR family transcriptional regulator
MMVEPKGIEGVQDEAARDRLLRAALSLFDRKGYTTTTVREIVEAAGVTKPVLYYYFGNKEGIFLALMREAFSAFSEMLSAAGQRRGSAREKILELCDGVYVLVKAKLPLIRVMYSLYYGPPQGAPAFDFDVVHLEFQAQIHHIMEEGIRSGELCSVPVQDAMWAVVGAMNIAIEVELCHPEQSLGREGLARILNLAFDGIAAVQRLGMGEKP